MSGYKFEMAKRTISKFIDYINAKINQKLKNLWNDDMKYGKNEQPILHKSYLNRFMALATRDGTVFWILLFAIFVCICIFKIFPENQINILVQFSEEGGKL